MFNKDRSNKQKFCCWINDEDKVVSFHNVEGYRLVEFNALEEFKEYYYQKTYWGYKVQ